MMHNKIPYRAFTKRPEIPKNHEIRKKCYLCGSVDNLEEEHVIPKVVFKITPNSKELETDNTVKLWACSICNRNKGQVDEEVTRHLQATGFTPTAYLGFSKLIQSAKEGRDGIHLLRKMAATLKKDEIKSPSGIYLGQGSMIQVNRETAEKYFTNIAKGLFVANTLQLYNWDEYDIVFVTEQLITSQTHFRSKEIQELYRQAKIGEYWKDTFSYRGHIDNEGSVWSMVSYGSHHSVVIFKKKPDDAKNIN